mmetsp:Transcript_21310/g.48115  ORF Transcript_21310/g.48115 Transcript_21310/m.48115 type:complete len:91 (+) Transcript_21310:146-418(+)|eukprot:749671-Hanusia_phi.AAC.6
MSQLSLCCLIKRFLPAVEDKGHCVLYGFLKKQAKRMASEKPAGLALASAVFLTSGTTIAARGARRVANSSAVKTVVNGMAWPDAKNNFIG